MNHAPAALLAVMFLATPMTVLPAHAQTAATTLQRFDSDRDGAISRDEITVARTSLFSRLDVNGDGAIDADEVEGLRDAIMDRAIVMQARLGNQIRRLDANGDDKVSRDEFGARAPLFEFADRDGDGKISAAEFLTVRNVLFNP